MSKLIYLSPSDQTSNKYAYGNTTEAIQCRKIADACEVALERCGFSVINNQKNSMWNRVKESNTKKADLHICIHTNAHNGKVSGTRMFSFDLKGEGYKIANSIFNYLAPLTPGKSENIKSADYYEIVNTNAPCAYCECEFHDVPSVAKWIIEHTKEIGEAIAKGVCKYYGISYVHETTQASSSTSESNSSPATKGNIIALENEPLYTTSSVKKAINKVSGTYYLWDNTVVNGRVRITNSPSRVGVQGQVTGWINASNVNMTSESYLVKVTANALNVRSGPGTNYKVNTVIRDKGIYTIVETSGKWGKLKSGAGWIFLDYTKKM